MTLTHFFSGFHHIALVCKDMAETIKFYEGAQGMKPRAVYPMHGIKSAKHCFLEVMSTRCERRGLFLLVVRPALFDSAQGRGPNLEFPEFIKPNSMVGWERK